MAIVIRYVDAESNVREEFIGFFQCKEGTKGVQIANLLMETASKLGLEMDNCQGQRYDGAGNMSGKYNGAATLISRDYLAALNSHCASHHLNLCIIRLPFTFIVHHIT